QSKSVLLGRQACLRDELLDRLGRAGPRQELFRVIPGQVRKRPLKIWSLLIEVVEQARYPGPSLRYDGLVEPGDELRAAGPVERVWRQRQTLLLSQDQLLAK